MKTIVLFTTAFFLITSSCNKSEKTDKKQNDPSVEKDKKAQVDNGEKDKKVHDCGKHTEAMKPGDKWHPSVFKAIPPEGTLISCPIKGETFKYSKARPHTEYKGKVYVFGCNGCKNIFLKDPEAALKKYKFVEAQ